MVPVNTPGAPTGSASVRLTASISPVVWLVTLTLIGPRPVWSGSVTCRETGAPTVVATMETVASVPPAIVSEALTVPAEPSSRNASE